jgi:hypothetical protein
MAAINTQQHVSQALRRSIRSISHEIALFQVLTLEG